MIKYNIDQIEDIAFSNNTPYQLPIHTLETIENLEKKVGSPNYVKTPVFKKQRQYTDDNWYNIRTFKTTKIKEINNKTEEIITSIRTILNKLTQETFENNKEQLLNILNENDLCKEDMLRVSELIFIIGSQNTFYSELYANLYKILMGKYEIMNDVFNRSFSNFIKLFDNIEYVNPDEDYDKFCVINKTNETRKALSKFFINLMNLNVIEENIILDIILKLQEMIYNYMEDKTKRNHIDEITENIFILVTEGANKLNTTQEFEEIINNINKIQNINKKEYIGITNKTIFKNMDIIDYLNKS
tara:strand:+ start:1368 stop:2270 length:903 start_codon:yes stop_codon:yes gene_type:complete